MEHMTKTSYASKLLEDRCKFYEYELKFDAGKIQIVCPGQKGLLSKTKTVIHDFDSIGAALLWFVGVMQETNRRCRRYGIEPCWSYTDIANTYSASSPKG